jgi:group I intron endonuclease
MGQIYGIYSKLENKIIYIGQTIIGYDKRFKKHLASCKSDNHCAIHAKIKKYGSDNFYSILLLECENDKLNEKEILFIEKYNTFKNGLNETIGGGTMSGYKHKEKTKQIIGEKLKRRWETDRENIIESLKRRPPRIQKNEEIQQRKKYLKENNPMYLESTKIKLSKTCKEKYENGYINPRTKNWKLTMENNVILEIFNLKQYCLDNKIKYISLYKAYKKQIKYKNIEKIEKV